MKYLSLLLLVSCGEAYIIQPGFYEVDITYTRDDWGPMSHEGETTTAVWEIQAKDNVYKLIIVNTNRVFTDIAGTDALYYREENFSACGLNSFTFEIHPGHINTVFTGNGRGVTWLCRSGVEYDPYSLITESELWGEQVAE